MTLFNNNICDLLLFNNNIHLSDSVLFVLYASTFVSLFEHFQYLLVMLYDHRVLYMLLNLQYQFCRCLTRLNSLSNLSY